MALDSARRRTVLLALLAAAAGTVLGEPTESREATVPGSTNPFAGQRLWVDSESNAARDVRRLRAANPRDANLLRRIATQPQAVWLGEWISDVRREVAIRVTAMRRAGAFPVLVAYDIPLRDCGGYSRGGARSAVAYERWVRRVAAGIGSRPAAVIVEPDALAGLDCLDRDRRRQRLRLVRRAVSILEARPRVAVYLDAGHSAWQPALVMARRLRLAGISRARGFALNVSNFGATRRELEYGRRISAATGGKHFVIDTSRNGRGRAPSGEWCNPPGRALGAPPRTRRLPSRLVDALLWVKRPGESDGSCRGGPPSGHWWRAYALGLARRAGR